MTEEEILKQISAGGRAQEMALKALYNGKAAAFKGHFVHKGVLPGAADDVLQDTIVKIFKNVATFRGDGVGSDNSANAWMWQIARNCCADHLRRAIPIDKMKVSINATAGGDPAESATEVMSKRERHSEIEKSNYTAQFREDTNSVNECIAAGLEDFAAEQPDRYQVLMMQMDGENIASIGNRIGRTMAATKEYLSQCRKKVAPYIAHCQVLLPI